MWNIYWCRSSFFCLQYLIFYVIVTAVVMVAVRWSAPTALKCWTLRAITRRSLCVLYQMERNFPSREIIAIFFKYNSNSILLKRECCDFIVFVISNNCSKFVQEHLESEVGNLSLFWRICILWEILGQWYTQKLDLRKELSSFPKVGHY